MAVSGMRGPAWRFYAAVPASVGLAREDVRRAVSMFSSPADPFSAELAVSEMATNAIRHGPGGLILVAWCQWTGGARLVVCDAGGLGVPHLIDDTSQDAESGRGLQLVDAISARWGSFTHEILRALVVWCDLAEPLPVPDADAWAWLYPVLAAVGLEPPPPTELPPMPRSRAVTAADMVI